MDKLYYLRNIEIFKKLSSGASKEAFLNKKYSLEILNFSSELSHNHPAYQIRRFIDILAILFLKNWKVTIGRFRLIIFY